jgi:predicted glycosyltransferase
VDNLRIWFDVLTPKQVLFFKPIIDNLLLSGNDVLCTSRQYRECIQLAETKGLKMKIIGRHAGPLKYEKLRESAKRTYELADVVRHFDPTFAVNFCSPEAARVAFGLGIVHIVFNDSPHALAVGKLTVPLAHHLLCPWIIPYNAWKNFGIQKKQITRYRALDPAVWIRRYNNESDPVLEPLRSKYFLTKKKTIVVRPVESKAAYIVDNAENSTISQIESLIEKFHDIANIVILSRYEDQEKNFSDRFGSKVTILGRIVDGLELLSTADIFIGAGGTMTAEAALLGKPTISISPIQFYVDDYLFRIGLVQKARHPRKLVQLVDHILKDGRIYGRQRRLAHRILATMEDPMTKLHRILNSYITL